MESVFAYNCPAIFFPRHRNWWVSGFSSTGSRILIYNRVYLEGLAISISIFAARLTFFGPSPNAFVVDKLQIAELFITFATTIITTSLIGYRIYSTSRVTGVSATSMQRFKYIIKVLLEPAAIYSLV